MAAEIVAAHLWAADSDHVLEASRKERERIFNLGYFTWVEQQGISSADFDRRKRSEFWRALQNVVPLWDEQIAKFNTDSGMESARA
jgi:hypothetical protein